MKRKPEKVPGFDEIIFENRNKTYGAYDLRKRYKSATSISILGVTAVVTLLITALTFTTEDGKAINGPIDVILVIEDPLIPEPINQPEIKPPAEVINAVRNLRPVVTDDTSQATTYIPTTDELNSTVQNGIPTDSVVFIEPTDPVIPVEAKTWVIVQEMPEFPGGNAALLRFVSENMKYPAEALENGIQGKVNLKFVVMPDGSIGIIEILRQVDPLLDNEAVRVVKTLPRFKPGKQNGVPVQVWFSLPVVFQIKSN
jgi:protein TonB